VTASAPGPSRHGPPYRAVVLGLGNVLCSDDGAGVVAVQRLRQDYLIPDDVLALDGGTLGLSLLPHVCDAGHLLILDAISARAAPGSVLRFDGDAVGAVLSERLSVHQVGVADLLVAARWLDRSPRRVALLGVVAASTALGFGCSAAVEAQLPRLVRAAARELDLRESGAGP
jgi:hydrogenase maturation protease